MSDLRYPVGKFEADPDVTEEKRRGWINEIAEAPARLRAAVDGLSTQQLNTPYRPNGWTVQQVAHHLPDSHLNGYTRFKLGLTLQSSSTMKKGGRNSPTLEKRRSKYL